jgi:hypothetical protein
VKADHQDHHRADPKVKADHQDVRHADLKVKDVRQEARKPVAPKASSSTRCPSMPMAMANSVAMNS